ncbi:hypothetical protein B0H21DRAFT_687466 [Amylocystis lapponica]|nr:hypothetical protein B0H21DRAFT_687466 [Amylocystis lapponica]
MESETQSRAPLPFLTYYVLALSWVIAWGLPFPARLAVFAAFAYVALPAVTMFTMGDAVQGYPFGDTYMSVPFNALHLLLLADLINEFRHETDIVPPTSLPLLRRVHWASSVINNSRGVGWNYQVSHLPPPPTDTRRAFIIGRLRRFVLLYLVVDALHSFTLHVLNPMYLSEGGDALPLTHSVLAVVRVAFGPSELLHWPNICGSWLDSYTIRRYWGRTWHQMLHRDWSSCRALGIVPGSWQSSYTQLYIAFTLFGFLHMGGDAMLGRGTFGESFWFFSQALAISNEDAVIDVAKRPGVRFPVPVERALGYFWTFAWGCYSLNFYLSYMLRMGLRSRTCCHFHLS